MIITLKGANFSQSNIGTLDSWFIAWSGSGLTAASGNATSIKKDGTSTTTLTYTYNTENYKYTSGTVKDATGATVGSVSASNGTVTVTINAGNTINGKITIAIVMEYIGVGEEPEPEPDTPVTPPSGGMDADATAFITAAAITDTAMKTKLDTLVKSLKSNNLWNKIDALYPCVGSTFEQMSYNLKNPTTFKMRSNSGTAPEVDSTGIKPTQLVVCDNYTTAPGQDFHTLAWDKDGYTTKHSLRIAICGVSIGVGNGDGGVQVQFYDNGTEGQVQIRTHGKDGRWNKKPCDVNPTGLVISSLTSGMIHNGVDLGTVMEGTPNFTKLDMLIGINGVADGAGKPYLGYRGLVGFGKGLTIAEMKTYSQILNEFKNIY